MSWNKRNNINNMHGAKKKKLFTMFAYVYISSFTMLHHMQKGAHSKHAEEFSIIGISVLKEISNPSDFEKLL
jgi:hypothetical protein